MFKKLLIANRGEIAVRIIRACKTLGIQTVAVHSDVDQGSLHVKLADESVCIGPAQSQKSYLAIDRILSAAEITGADAIHPGYGFLSENADFANICKKCGITFVGPTAEQIETMGDKIESRNTMREAGLPMLPSLELKGEDSNLLSKLESFGLPLIVKASAGGGGKGIKIIRNLNEAERTISLARSEAKAAFGDDTVFIEKYIENAKHIEFQVVGDGKKIIHLGERDCSIQRRYQKILEEAPCAILPQNIRDRMGRVVTEALEKIGYQSVGTVEFLMDEQFHFYFLEMNTRIQVEHPITEEITGIDLVRLQIELAQGKPLTFNQSDIRFEGHAIEMRINAEDPVKCLPSSGAITFLHTPGGPGVRLDHGMFVGSVASPFYDSLLGKLIVKGQTREHAIERARGSIEEFKIEGIQTNLDLHKRILREQKFINNNTGVKYLDNLLKS